MVFPFLVKAVAQEGGMEMCVIHPFCLKYVRVKELKTDVHIPYATELFYLYVPIRKAGKVITKNVRHLQMVKKKFKITFCAGFQIKPKFYFRYQRPRSSEIYPPKTHLTSVAV